MPIDIREYSKEDHADLIRMTTGLMDHMAMIDPHKRFRKKEDFDGAAYTDMWIEKAEKEGGKVLVATDDGKPIGYIIGTVEDSAGVHSVTKYPEKMGTIEDLFVDEEHRVKGVSTLLLKEIEEYFKSNGCHFVAVGCLAANDTAVALYSKRGYNEQYIDFFKKL